jgi:hypothetical protein
LPLQNRQVPSYFAKMQNQLPELGSFANPVLRYPLSIVAGHIHGRR